MISFIIPAHNEEFEIGKTLESITQSARAVDRSYEILVVNDGSTDRTPEIAHSAGARVLDVNLRRISAVRNAGAREARGELFFFVDADTQISNVVLREALTAIDQGAVGGGAWVNFAEYAGRSVEIGIRIFGFFYARAAGWAAGCFLFVRREDFNAVGGFDETLYATEEIFLSRKLKKRGRFAIGRSAVTTSARKMRMYSAWQIIPLTLRFLVGGMGIFRRREGMEWWYEGKREK